MVAKTSNADIAMLLGGLVSDMGYVKKTVEKLDHTINGNGKPGLMDRVKTIEYCHNIEAKEKKETKEKAEKWGARTWAVVLIFITQAVGILVLFIRTGGIK